MDKKTEDQIKSQGRRDFFKIGGGLLTGSLATNFLGAQNSVSKDKASDEKKIIRYKKLGRTGFKASDIGMGTTRFKHPNIARFAYDHGINYFDTAEGYHNGEAEKNLGKALKHMDRNKVFITTKVHIDENDSKEKIIQKFNACQKRLDTEYIDALYMHGVNRVDFLDHQGFHAATKKLRQEERLKFIGLSCHGPHNEKQDSMEDVLCAAAEDGRFDLMLLVYNFMNSKAGDRIIKACKENNVGTTAMKTSPGVLNFEPVDPDNLTKSQEKIVERLQNIKGYSRRRAIRSMQSTLEDKSELKKIKKFAKKYELQSELEFYKTSIKWVISNPDLHSACISFNNFEQLNALLPLSGTELSYLEKRSLEEYNSIFNSEYCRHGCQECLSRCSNNVPVNRIMRYAYYFQCQHREKDSMRKYYKLENNAEYCTNCEAPCVEACPYDLNVPVNLLKAHDLLSLT
ncbi:MAG: aldo/keto reductase [Candidatus Marinimicrobia bacterium]|nr:aldo/keto reductase [Candidatus Neomarinimicrobiota bacterium]